MGKSFDPMGWGCAGAGREADGCTPRPIVSMSFQLAIPGRVALPQSPPPLHQPGAIMKQRAAAGQQKPANGMFPFAPGCRRTGIACLRSQLCAVRSLTSR